MRVLRLLASAAGLWLVLGTIAAAQTATWPDVPEGSLADPKAFVRGPGFYFDLVKLVLVWILFLCWVRTVDWVNRSGHEIKINFRLWNMAVAGPFVACFLLMLALPSTAAFFIGYPLMFLAWVVPMFLYAATHNGRVGENEKVFTVHHMKRFFGGLVGKKVKDKKDPREAGAQVKFIPKGGKTDGDNQGNLMVARNAAGFLPARELVHELAAQRGDAMLLDYAQDGVACRIQVDGVWHNAQNRERETADAALEVLKTICALNPADRRSKQVGEFGAETEGRKLRLRFTSQGVPTGERVLMQQIEVGLAKKRLPDVGMRDKMQEQLKEVLNRKKGFVVLSSPPGGGLSTMMHAVVGTMDRYMRSFVGLEDQTKREMEMENVPVKTFDPQGGDNSSEAVLARILREYPDAIVASEPSNAATMDELVEQSDTDRFVVTSIRAKEASEALLRCLMLKTKPQPFIHNVSASLNCRLIRKLCESCREAYQPPPEVMQQLGLPPGRVQAFYRPPTPNPEQKEVCKQCNGLGYHGRTALFELLVVDDGVRQALLRSPQLDTVRNMARKAGMRTLQEEGIVLVAKGVTSLPELMRVLKE